MGRDVKRFTSRVILDSSGRVARGELADIVDLSGMPDPNDSFALHSVSLRTRKKNSFAAIFD